jgi:hypothetical protein
MRQVQRTRDPVSKKICHRRVAGQNQPSKILSKKGNDVVAVAGEDAPKKQLPRLQQLLEMPPR